MDLLKAVIFSVISMALISCGDRGGKVKEAVEIENGVSKAEDGRIILSSESKPLVMPEGVFKGVEVDPRKLGSAIAGRLDSVSTVYDISFASRFFISGLVGGGVFNVVFAVRTLSGEVYRNIKCMAYPGKGKDAFLWIEDCNSGQVRLAFALKPYRLRDVATDLGLEQMRSIAAKKFKRTLD